MRKGNKTRYNGIVFRSKLESLWAQYFDSIDLKYKYEPKNNISDSIYYLPDFLITIPVVNGNISKIYSMYFEVKPDIELWAHETRKIKSFSRLNHKGLVLLKGYPTDYRGMWVVMHEGNLSIHSVKFNSGSLIILELNIHLKKEQE